MSNDPTELAKRALRMSAYYYGFTHTGVEQIDKILSAVACAGKAFHHTDCWNDETFPYEGHTGASPIEWIQNAANEAATVIRAYLDLKEKYDELEARYEELKANEGWEPIGEFFNSTAADKCGHPTKKDPK